MSDSQKQLELTDESTFGSFKYCLGCKYTTLCREKQYDCCSPLEYPLGAMFLSVYLRDTYMEEPSKDIAE